MKNVQKRRQAVETQFNALLKQKEQKETELNDINVELTRLQGAARELDSWLEDVSTEANKIELKEKK